MIRKVIIVAPHFPPSNLAAVHRSRLFAQHLGDFGWQPLIVAVDSRHYEERLDQNLARLVSDSIRVERVSAFGTSPFRVVGDIGIRGFVPMLRRILALIDSERVDFLYITIPSFYGALLGPIVHRLRGIPYGIDYIDPWVQSATGKDNLKARASQLAARILEPLAVSRASLITGVAEGYFLPVLERNRSLVGVETAAMPYGGEARDHAMVSELGIHASLFPPHSGRLRFVYAGALLPRATEPLRRICAALAASPALAGKVEFFFIGSGSSPDDDSGYNVRPIAEEFGLWASTIYEFPRRISYLETLAHLDAADATFILGSTEPHYTPSKVYQCILARKPILAVLHELSTACSMIRDTKAGLVLEFAGEAELGKIEAEFSATLSRFLAFAANFGDTEIDQTMFSRYSGREVTATLAAALDRAINSSTMKNDGA